MKFDIAMAILLMKVVVVMWPAGAASAMNVMNLTDVSSFESLTCDLSQFSHQLLVFPLSYTLA